MKYCKQLLITITHKLDNRCTSMWTVVEIGVRTVALFGTKGIEMRTSGQIVLETTAQGRF